MLGRLARLEPLEVLAMDELEGERYNTRSEGAREDMPAKSTSWLRVETPQLAKHLYDIALLGYLQPCCLPLTNVNLFLVVDGLVSYVPSSTPDSRLARTLAAFCRGHSPFQHRTKLLNTQIHKKNLQQYSTDPRQAYYF